MKKLPIYIIEEHHEAFIIWNHAIKQGYLLDSDNILFHVDEHSDMANPQLNVEMICLENNMEEVSKFTYNELGIASFIIPACYNKMFKEVYWFKQNHRNTHTKPIEMYVRSYNGGKKKLISGKTADIMKTPQISDIKYFKYYLYTIERMPSDASNIVLDIDLDYFSCSGNPNLQKEIYIEISHNEYQHFQSNKYHRLHYVGFARIDCIEKLDKYYYVLNDFKEVYPSILKVDFDTIEKRIDKFITMLVENSIKPSIINICRSRYSGYTPIDQWQLIEEKLLKRLNEIYTIEFIKTINDIQSI